MSRDTQNWITILIIALLLLAGLLRNFIGWFRRTFGRTPDERRQDEQERYDRMFEPRRILKNKG